MNTCINPDLHTLPSVSHIIRRFHLQPPIFTEGLIIFNWITTLCIKLTENHSFDLSSESIRIIDIGGNLNVCDKDNGRCSVSVHCSQTLKTDGVSVAHYQGVWLLAYGWYNKCLQIGSGAVTTPDFFCAPWQMIHSLDCSLSLRVNILAELLKILEKWLTITQDGTRETTMITGAYNMRDTKTVLEAVLRVKNTHKN